LLGACGFSSGVPDDAATDGHPDAPPVKPSCVDAWLAGPTFTMPIPLHDVNTSAIERDTFVSYDELTLYMSGDGDIHVSTRASTAIPFPAAIRDDDLSSNDTDTKVSFTMDGMTAFINSSRAGSSNDIWRATRTSIPGTWSFDQVGLGAINSSGNAWDPHISLDGLRLYFAPQGAQQYIHVASRQSTASDFDMPVRIEPLVTADGNADPTLSGDERVIVYVTTPNGDRDLWYATRATPNGTFAAPLSLPSVINDTFGEHSPHLTADGCTLYYTSDRSGNGDLWMTMVQ
jgi:Tol biopolymer transport system component